jgi:phosphoribosylformimino-5-aminoimidazole carboxamide ribotide isomerase
MRLIPVIDLLNGQVVHAVKGDRAKYSPIRSVLCDNPNPTRIARAFRDTLGLHELYIADLNAIQNGNPSTHLDIIASLASRERIDIILDAGISTAQDARFWFDRSIHKIIVGSETLSCISAIQKLPATIGPSRLVFSLDTRAGKLISRCAEFSVLLPTQALKLLDDAGWEEVVLLDLGKVGSGEGFDRATVRGMQTSFPHMKMLVGGGIANLEDLVELKSMGIAGVLAATSLHRGTVTPHDVSVLLDREAR